MSRDEPQGTLKDTISLAGLVLAGGRSRRFGRDKALAPFGGRTLLQIAVERFSPCAACAVAARDRDIVADRAHALGAIAIEDRPNAAEGPLAGIAAGLAWAKRRDFGLLAIAPCDAPLLAWRHYERLIQALGDAPAAFATTDAGEHPLCAIWRTELQGVLDAEMADGSHPSVRDFLHSCGARRVKFSDANAFANANTDRELEQLATESLP